MPDGHRTAELRSLAFHELVAERLDEQRLLSARRRVEGWLERGEPVDPRIAERWRELLARPLPEVAAALRRDDEPMRDLRQSTPFAGAVEPRERWQIIREVR